MTVRTLILASASPARLATLRAAGLDPQVQVSAVDEEALLARTGTSDPGDVVALLAKAKAEDVAARAETAAIVLGCDSMLDLDGVALGKPRDAAEAVRRWQQMRGRSGQLRTGHWLIDVAEAGAVGAARAIGATSVTTVHFADVSDDEIKAYVATGEPLQVAGAFTVDGLGGAFVTGIEGDYHGVVGVSLPLLRDLLADLDVPWTSLWAG
jgi:septum formation protein